jgi:hypothetical protein
VSVATGTAVDRLEVFAKTIPTDEPESDGTFEWDSTTIVVVQAHAGGLTGLGYTYTHDAVGGADRYARAGAYTHLTLPTILRV